MCRFVFIVVLFYCRKKMERRSLRQRRAFSYEEIESSDYDSSNESDGEGNGAEDQVDEALSDIDDENAPDHIEDIRDIQIEEENAAANESPDITSDEELLS